MDFQVQAQILNLTKKKKLFRLKLVRFLFFACYLEKEVSRK